MHPLDSLLHLGGVVFVGECLQYVSECGGWRFNNDLALVVLLALLLQLVLPLLLRLHDRLLYVVHHLVRLRDRAVIVVNREEFLFTCYRCVHVVDDAPDLDGFVHHRRAK